MESTVVNVSTVQPYDDETQGYVSQELALRPTLGSGRGDPFACIPINHGPETHALLDHCTYTFHAEDELITKARTVSVSCARTSGASQCLVNHP
jgi:hypothetical protein